ncbi:hypothetical protein [uncultured Halomonas sp.]|uniref:hypothetical protein n=1 Tax=uncultured Halomonas sp. TaxID=173971 RepID=UPI002614DA60|nr:hypothetical protein [uncultured Halomonas sp.]
MTKTSLLLGLLLAPSLAFAATLELPADARLEVQVVESLSLDPDTPRHDDVLLRPVANGSGSHQVPDYCVMVGDAQLDGERIRITTSSVTCIDTEGSDSHIYSGEISAAAYGSDGKFGIDACQDGRCELSPEHGFELQLASDLAIEEQENPSEQINIERRQAEGNGVANPIPADQPDPDDSQP